MFITIIILINVYITSLIVIINIWRPAGGR